MDANKVPTSNPIGETVSVVYVAQRDAKKVKDWLEDQRIFNKDYRLTPSTSGQYVDCLALPVLQCDQETLITKQSLILGQGSQFCRYSTSLLGNHVQRKPGQCREATLVQTSLVAALGQFAQENSVDLSEDELWNAVRSMNRTVCPKSLELLGDDNTLVVHRNALEPKNPEFNNILRMVGCGSEHDRSVFLYSLWGILASSYNSPRVVRKGEVDPDSRIRESGYRLLWPFQGTPDTTGPGSHGWITVTEQGVRQSFDLTRVMFSRGNITEKIRFGKLVQRGEIVLDLYAGIGYFTLPALVQGQAGYVYACEWNPRAVEALEYNLRDNEVEDRAIVYQGDCRTIAREKNLVDKFDRVSLGLLPSSEGGWRTGVLALRRATGGWLHIHGNVPVKELNNWAHWLCCSLREFVAEINMGKSWIVCCTHIEKVKSFAPTVCHYVADVYVGPPNRLSVSRRMSPGSAAVCANQEMISYVPSSVDPPSCALSPNGVLYQDWMREEYNRL